MRWSSFAALLLGSAACHSTQVTRRQLIVGGEESRVDDAYFATLSFMYGAPFCGGAILSEEWVLTAAHCLDEGEQQLTESLYVRAGINYIHAKGPRVRVDQVFIHPDWDGNLHDLALVHLSAPLTLERGVIETIRLSSNGAQAGSYGTVYGHGATTEYIPRGSLELLMADLQVGSRDQCLASNEGHSIEGYICAGGEQAGVGTCYGDSGGPFTQNDLDGVRTLVGIVSFGSGPCDQLGSWSFFSDVSKYISWVAETTRLRTEDIATATASTQAALEPSPIATTASTYGILDTFSILPPPPPPSATAPSSMFSIPPPPPPIAASAFALPNPLPPPAPLATSILVEPKPIPSTYFKVNPAEYEVQPMYMTTIETFESQPAVFTEENVNDYGQPVVASSKLADFLANAGAGGMAVRTRSGSEPAFIVPPPPATVESCIGRCNAAIKVGDTEYACHCDSKCEKNGDCCEDFESLCKNSCQNACGLLPGYCYCDAGCLLSGDCCADYASFC